MASRRYPRTTPPINSEARAKSQALRGSKRFRSELSRDLAAMAKVWKLIRQGAVRWLGEVGRQY